jgi:hypothetical protein
MNRKYLVNQNCCKLQIYYTAHRGVKHKSDLFILGLGGQLNLTINDSVILSIAQILHKNQYDQRE